MITWVHQLDSFNDEKYCPNFRIGWPATISVHLHLGKFSRWYHRVETRLIWVHRAGRSSLSDCQPCPSVLWGTDSHHCSALLHIQALGRIPNNGTYRHIKCLHGVKKEWPRLMCSRPWYLFPCLFSIVLQVSCLQECVVTRIYNKSPTACDWQHYSASSPKEHEPRSLEPWKVMRSWRQLSQSVCPSFL